MAPPASRPLALVELDIRRFTLVCRAIDLVELDVPSVRDVEAERAVPPCRFTPLMARRVRNSPVHALPVCTSLVRAFRLVMCLRLNIIIRLVLVVPVTWRAITTMAPF